MASVVGSRPRNGWKQARRESLLEAADRVVRRLGPAASMEDFAGEAGVSKVVLYRYFSNKSGLYRALIDRFTAALMSELRRAMATAQDPKSRLRSTIEAYVVFIKNNREAYDFLVHRAIREGPGITERVVGFMRLVAQEVGVALAEEIRALGIDPLPAEAWAHGLVGMVQLAADWWLEAGSISRRQLVDYLVELVWQGFSGMADQYAARRL